LDEVWLEEGRRKHESPYFMLVGFNCFRKSCIEISDGRLRLAFLPFMSLAARNPLSAGGVGAPGRER